MTLDLDEIEADVREAMRQALPSGLVIALVGLRIPELIEKVRQLSALGDEMAAALEFAQECLAETDQDARRLLKPVEAWRHHR